MLQKKFYSIRKKLSADILRPWLKFPCAWNISFHFYVAIYIYLFNVNDESQCNQSKLTLICWSTLQMFPIRKWSACMYVLLGHFQQTKRMTQKKTNKINIVPTFLRVYCAATFNTDVKWIEYFLSIINNSKPFSRSVSATEFIRLSNLFVLIISIHHVCSYVLCMRTNERARTFLSADLNARQNLLNPILSLSF